MSDPLIRALAATALTLEAEAPPPLAVLQEALSEFFGILVLPLALLFLGGLVGGLRAVLGSPLRGHLLREFPEERCQSLEKLLERHPTLPTAAGLLRLLFVGAAVAVMVESTTGDLSPFQKWGAWLTLVLVGGVMLEGFPAMGLHARGLRVLLAFLPLVRLFEVPLRPFAALIQSAARGMGGNVGDNPNKNLVADMLDVAHDSDREEILHEMERRMISRIMDLPDTDAAEVMTPRTSLVAVEGSSSIADAIRLSTHDGHSRIPVYEENLDQVKGVFYVKDVLERVLDGEDLGRQKVRECMRDAYFVPETMRFPSLFEEMRRRRLHMAVVVDEYGGTAGVVTVEDMLEEIVGEIQDEHDRDSDEVQIERVGPGELMVDGSLSVAELNETLGSELPEDDDYDTVAGLLFDRFGHIPTQGESLREDGVVLEVVEADDRRIHRVRVSRDVSRQGSDAA